jgi:hypothetical protein
VKAADDRDSNSGAEHKTAYHQYGAESTHGERFFSE